MRRMKWFGLILTLVSITACAPVVYDATYRAPVQHVVVQHIYSQPPVHHQEVVYRQAQPIEVTLYANNTYLGVYFQPLHLTINDGQYIEIPLRDRRGRQSKFYAHYHQNNLHFDADRNCQGIQGSSRFNADNRWDKGYRYSHINAGKDYDLTGLQLQIRKVPARAQSVSKKSPVRLENKAAKARYYQSESPAKRPVVVKQKGNIRRVGFVNNDKRPAVRQTAVVAEKTTGRRTDKRDKQLIIKDKGVEAPRGKGVKSANKPTIVKKLVADKRSQSLTKSAIRIADKKMATDRNSEKRKTDNVDLLNGDDATETQESANNKQKGFLAQNDRSNEESVQDSRSNRKTDARGRVFQGNRSR